MVLALLFAAFMLLSCAEMRDDNPYDKDSKNYIGNLPGNSSGSNPQGGGNQGTSSSSRASSSSRTPSIAVVDGDSVKYEGETYPTVVIGTQTWFAKNLNYDLEGSCCSYHDVNDPENCSKYGRLYDWEMALTICPSGWHLPSYEEWCTLFNYVESEQNCSDCAAKFLKTTSGWGGWNNSGDGSDIYGFAALPGGYGGWNNSCYLSLTSVGSNGSWWSATEFNATIANWLYMMNDRENAEGLTSSKGERHSVRCLKD